jgi:hypothetical protein
MSTFLSTKPVEADASVPNLELQQEQRASPPTSFLFISISGLNNFRDIGGWPIVSPTGDVVGHVRKGLLYRGSDTNRITPEGVERLRELGVTVDFDLRSKQQIVNTGGYRDMEGIERRWTPVFGEEEYTEEEFCLSRLDGLFQGFWNCTEVCFQ